MSREANPCPHDLTDCLACALVAAELASGGRLASLAVVEGSDPLRWRAVGANGLSAEGEDAVRALESLVRSSR